MRIGIIGLGNPLRRDDGVGLIILDNIRKRMINPPCDIDYLDAGTPGVRLIHYISRYDVVVLIDAVDFNGEPGECILSTPEELESRKKTSNVSTHEEDVLNILKLGKNISEYPDELYIFGVQPSITSVGIGLSYELERALPRIVDDLERKIKVITQRKRKNIS
jgi:hydrogenase maturation protease